jgi:hypothetical protein
MRGIADVDGHALYVEWTEVAPDSMEGRIHCECGWSERSMKSCWFIRTANAHLEETYTSPTHGPVGNG